MIYSLDFVLGFSLLFLPVKIRRYLVDLKEKLTQELTKELPGELAHSMMMPSMRNDNLRKPTGNPPPLKSAVLILFYPDDDGHYKFPLIQRPDYNGAHSAQVSFPGGKAEPSDETLIITALREAEEEIGIRREQVEVIGHLTDLFIWVSNYMVTPIVSVANSRPKFVKDQKEVDTIIEADLYDIVNPLRRKEGTIIVREKYKIQTPYFDIDNRVVWGATAMMLNELSMILDKARVF